MRLCSLFSTAALVLTAGVRAADTDILQIALYLENFEAAYYSKITQTFAQADFTKAGFNPAVYTEVGVILKDEQAHVTALQAAISPVTIPPCTYNFTAALTSVPTAMAYLLAIEEVGVRAYTGAIAQLTSATSSTAAAIGTIEARHSAYLEKISKNRITVGPFDNPIGARSIASAVSQTGLVTNFASCAPFGSYTVYAALTTTSTLPLASGANVALTTTATGATFCLFSFGVDNNPTSAYTNGQCTLPVTTGYTAITVWLANSNTAYNFANDLSGGSQSNIVAGPLFLQTNDGFTYVAGADISAASSLKMGSGMVAAAAVAAGMALAF